MATFSSFEDAWGPGPESVQVMASQQAPQKSFSGGNSPQKVMSNSNPPQKVFSTGEPADQRDMVLANMMEHGKRQSQEIMRLERMVNSLAQQNNNNANMQVAASKSKTSLSVLEISVLVIALVFIVLVLYLISLVRRINL